MFETPALDVRGVQVFSDLDFLGWYTTGEGPTEGDIGVHKQVCGINESPVLLKLNPQARHTELPVAMYESVIDLVGGQATMLFVELPYTLATEEAERIGLDHMARMSAMGESGESSLVAQHLQVGSPRPTTGRFHCLLSGDSPALRLRLVCFARSIKSAPPEQQMTSQKLMCHAVGCRHSGGWG